MNDIKTWKCLFALFKSVLKTSNDSENKHQQLNHNIIGAAREFRCHLVKVPHFLHAEAQAQRGGAANYGPSWLLWDHIVYKIHPG